MNFIFNLQMVNRIQENINKIINWITVHKIQLACSLLTVLLSYSLYRSWKISRNPENFFILQLRNSIERNYQQAEPKLVPLNISRQHLVSDDDFDMKFILVPRLQDKQKHQNQLLKNPFLPPFEEGMHIRQMGNFHRLLYNKFNIYQKHLLLVSKQYQSQEERLMKMDFKQTILTVKAVEGMFFYNCGVNSGASQPHKHVQILPKQATNLPIYQKIVQFVRKNSDNSNKNLVLRVQKLDFFHGIYIFNDNLDCSHLATALKKAQQTLYQFCLEPQSYNLLGCDRFLMMIPRVREKVFNQIAVNSVVFMGSFLFREEKLMQKFLSLQIKPLAILKDITYPSDYHL